MAQQGDKFIVFREHGVRGQMMDTMTYVLYGMHVMFLGIGIVSVILFRMGA
jgi:hypothetical protein